jgi:hypothetical protein
MGREVGAVPVSISLLLLAHEVGAATLGRPLEKPRRPLIHLDVTKYLSTSTI